MDEQDLRAWVRGWPGLETGVKWQDDLVFSVGGKMFGVLCLRGTTAGNLSFKVEDHRFLELTERPGFIPAPYLARARWVQVVACTPVPATELRALLRRSYELVRARLPMKAQRDLAD